MKMKQSTLAATLTAALAMGAAAPAVANVYGVSTLHIQGLTISIVDAGGNSQDANTFNFSTTNTASLNGASVIEDETCSGTFGGTHDCGAGSPRLDAQPANAPGGDVTRLNNTFNLFGPGTDQYSNSDSVIQTAQLLGDGSTETQQIAESELQGGTSANSEAEIQSTTGFTFDFDVVGTATFTLDFEAMNYLLAQIGAGIDGGAAQANINASFTLSQQEGGNGFATWAPNGSLDGNCFVNGGITCTENADGASLNTNVGTTTAGTSDTSGALGAFNNFGVTATGLTEGRWTLTLNANTSNLLTQQVQQVPEPGMLALLGIGLAGLGLAARRRRLN